MTVVVSRANASNGGQISQATFEKGIKGSIDLVVPEDVDSLTTTANSGKSLGALAPRAAITKALRELGLRLAGAGEAPAKAGSSSFWKKISGDGKVKAEKRGQS
jgi:Flp pilus assembly CpaE family ATPase